jgi:diketogulonate reductase-like aldo/keto reductase
MQRRTFGPTGVAVPVIGQGTWQLRDAAAAERSLRLGLDLGVNHIDTAELYRGSEEIVGRAIQGRRDDVFLVSKVLPRNASYRGTIEACAKSLRRLETDHLDVYLLHWVDGSHPAEDTFRAMGELADEGKVRWVGVSNHTVEEMEQAQAALGPKHRLVCNQVYYDLAHRHVETMLLPYCRQKGVAIVGYSPFGSGRGTLPEASSKPGRVLEDVASRHGVTPHQVVLAFLAREPEVFLIPKAEKEAHVRDNAAAGALKLSRDDVAALDAAFPVPDRARELPVI